VKSGILTAQIRNLLSIRFGRRTYYTWDSPKRMLEYVLGYRESITGFSAENVSGRGCVCARALGRLESINHLLFWPNRKSVYA
jgi:hypothetical protein